MKPNPAMFLILCLLSGLSTLQAQLTTLTVAKQTEDFTIFRGALQEGHAGLHYFIEKKVFDRKCDSIQQTFGENASVASYYLKLRYLITLDYQSAYPVCGRRKWR